MGVNLVEKCLVILFTEFTSSIQFPLPLSETGFMRRSLMVLLNLSAKTAHFNV